MTPDEITTADNFFLPAWYYTELTVKLWLERRMKVNPRKKFKKALRWLTEIEGEMDDRLGQKSPLYYREFYEACLTEACQIIRRYTHHRTPQEWAVIIKEKVRKKIREESLKEYTTIEVEETPGTESPSPLKPGEPFYQPFKGGVKKFQKCKHREWRIGRTNDANTVIYCTQCGLYYLADWNEEMDGKHGKLLFDRLCGCSEEGVVSWCPTCGGKIC